MNNEYDYENGLKRLDEILNSRVEVKEKAIIPRDGEFTFDNAYRGWVSAIFVDIRNSTSLFTDMDYVKVSRVIRAFTSELIEILRKDDKVREIGIRGDCVYAIYATPSQEDIFNIAELTFWVNTFMKMLNRRLCANNLPNIKIGIGMAAAEELVVKAGRDHTKINSKVWIGQAVTYASKLSGMANKYENAPVLFSKLAYINFIDILENRNVQAKTWFTKKFDLNVGYYYMADIIKTNFDKWIKGI